MRWLSPKISSCRPQRGRLLSRAIVSSSPEAGRAWKDSLAPGHGRLLVTTKCARAGLCDRLRAKIRAGRGRPGAWPSPATSWYQGARASGGDGLAAARLGRLDQTPWRAGR